MDEYFTENKSSYAMQIAWTSMCPPAQQFGQDVRPFHLLLLDIFSLAAVLITTLQTIISLQIGLLQVLDSLQLQEVELQKCSWPLLFYHNNGIRVLDCSGCNGKARI